MQGTSTPFTEPIDHTHAESLEARDIIRARFTLLRAKVATWTPRPMPARRGR